MKYAILSDLHIGSEDFIRNSYNFVSFLKYLEKNYDKIILLGDIVECYYIDYPWKQAKQFLRTIRKYKKITSHFFLEKYIWLSGNHDLVSKHHWDIPDLMVISDNKIKIFLTHGHRYESIYAYPVIRFFTERIVWFSYKLKTKGYPGLYNYLMDIDRKNNSTNGGKQYIKKAKKLCQKYGYDFVIMGHTHHEKIVEFDKGVYINTGDCKDRKMFVSIDTKKKKYRINYFE